MDATIRHREAEGSRPTAWRVGGLAARMGPSVRTLPYYDEIGLLSPSQRTHAGHRLYTAGDVVRLQRRLCDLLERVAARLGSGEGALLRGW